MLTSFNYQVFLNKKIKINVVFAIRVVDTAWSHDLTERHVHRGMRFWLRRHVSASGWTKPQTQHAAGALPAAICGAGAHAPCVPQQDELLTQDQRPGKRNVRGVRRRLHTYTPAASHLPTRPAKNIS